MTTAKILEAEIWCPRCKHFMGKAWRKEVREGMWEHFTEPKKMPKYCSDCEGVLERK